MRRRLPAVLLCLCLIACGDADPRCEAFARDSVWAFVMTSDIGERFEGEVRIVDSARRIVGVRTAPDGGLMALDERVENFWIRGDSFRFLFSDDDYVIRGRCLDATRAAVIYAAPLIERGRPVSGRGLMTRGRQP